MSPAVQGQLTTLALVMVFVVFGVARRIRPQQVRPGRIAVSGVIIVLVVGASLVGTGGRIIEDPLAVLLIPVFLVVGAALGYYLVRTMSFWRDGTTGELWMRGGVLFAVILILTIAVRFGVRAVVYGSLYGPTTTSATGGHGLAYDLSADLLFVSLGLWASRAYFLVQRYRAHQAGTPFPAN